MPPHRSSGLNAALHTPRLVLEPLLGSHAAALFPILWDPGTQRWIAEPRATSVADLTARWTRNETRTSPDGATAWLGWAVRRVEDGVYIGKIDAEVDAQLAPHLAPNVGYVFSPAYWGRGYATEAVSATVAHLITHGVTELHATVTVGNDASCRVLERCGFERARVLAANDVIRGVAHDDWLYVRRVGG
ncbi:MAG: GNAT family N-acetyltransferase [Myxococcota bacterium]